MKVRHINIKDYLVHFDVKIHQTRKSVFDHILKHQEESWKYDMQWRVYDVM